ncbi:MAG: 16S rRNA (adenine(1518)-N(6)/adenine(1519)-N(6))-dimethyltransferase RsmA [Acidimicrobiales bacterium]|jgi:16S rRNA (adenine1518-N6/adenine1519-N6)-dimethyltransferase|nr:16S rRNA (adenine(1518)-N(6)/adenine(1519)-N(6))-dimethyltransferase RsmA [Acidimicrobiales bacterium]MDP6297968.1 16S rRNA (adenine(1518)-N(6)/adenine(1519)-N(6))-dimethyltransferase RsmA [Acidimicrobiales bacterium]HJM27917.1 16S rRNA (adenine(1518)-N(6)/adenine(1519)-N(6))-dimethyltransferase RsmA [Acidimicrobiales bacterium]HJM97935.1 16S rRNA (adenine(1518)-N(6)/adenine(1519)-N(6))-dimethyltransferase RsmA [Acidimicrobiales bacterium]
MTLGKKDLIDLMERHQIKPSKSLGQNFVIDPNTIHKIIREAKVKSEDQILEIGPGFGSLTCELSKFSSVVAIEYDRFLLPALSEVLNDHGVEQKVQIIHADAMKIPWKTFLSERKGTWKMISNLPYNIASPLLINILEQAPEVEEIYVMVQKEVAERFAAIPGTSAYGIPSVKSQYWAEAKILGRISPEVFYPIPRIDSALLQFKRRTSPIPVNIKIFNQIVRNAFTHRRKMLRKSIGHAINPSVFDEANIDPRQRPEELSVKNWIDLANGLHAENQ